MMLSPKEKFEQRRQKTRDLNANKKGADKMSDDNKKPDWATQLHKSEWFQMAEKVGINISFKPNSEESYKNLLELLQKELLEISDEQKSRLSKEDQKKLADLAKSQEETMADYVSASPATPDKPADSYTDESADQTMNLQEDAEQTEKQQPENTENNAEPELSDNDTPTDTLSQVNRDSLEVGAIADTPTLELDWIVQKRQFWKEYAESIDHAFENEPEKDEESKTFSCALTKDENRGEMKYTSPHSVQISKESHLEIYQGLVKDALQNNLSITFGQSLDDTQKALLLASCLMNQEKYKDGGELSLVNPPKIDTNAEYFKNLPQDVQQVLQNYAQDLQTKEKQKEISSRLAAAKDKIKSSKDQNERYAARQEQLSALKEQVLIDPSQSVSKDQETVEKIMAARMGIINDSSVKDIHGNQITKDETYTKKKNQQNPALYSYLKTKYQTQNK